MKVFVLSNEDVRKLAFIADVFEREHGSRPSVIDIIHASINCFYLGYKLRIDHVCDDDP